MAQALNDMIETLRKLGGKDMVNEIAKEAAPMLEDALKSTAKAGTSPTGKPWEPRKKDGAPALQGAASDISVKSHGPIVRATLTGGPVYAQVGARGPVREVIPASGGEIPGFVNELAAEAAGKVFDRIMGGS